MISESEKILLLGHSGVLGTSLEVQFKKNNLTKVSRSEIKSWIGANGISNLYRFIAELGTDVTIINALGLTDPKASIEQLQLLNTILPKQILNVVNDLDLKLITFGTIMERDASLESMNPYIKSKVNFYKSLQEIPVTRNHLHLHLHTIYGGRRSHPHMFIDQMYNCLDSRSEFQMSSGFQIREYHHIDDEVIAIAKLIELDLFGFFDLNAGNGIQLNQLATSVFKEFGQLSLLKFNSALDGIDVYNRYYEKSPILADVSFRDPIVGVTEYFKLRQNRS